MHVILTGATGLVGSSVLHHILSLSTSTAKAKQLSQLTILTRNPSIPLLSHPSRPTDNTHTDITIISHDDFTSYPTSLLSRISSPSTSTGTTSPSPIAIIWALGMSQNDATSAAQYTSVTKTYALSAARSFATHFAPAPVTFVYVSGEGATRSPGMFTPLFGRVKGETEQELLALSREVDNLTVFNVRPAGVDPRGQKAVEEIWSERVGKEGWVKRAEVGVLLPVLRAGVWSGMHSPTGEVSRVLLGLGLGWGKGGPLVGNGVEDGGWTVRNVGLRRLAREMEVDESQ